MTIEPVGVWFGLDVEGLVGDIGRLIRSIMSSTTGFLLAGGGGSDGTRAIDNDGSDAQTSLPF